MNLKTVLCFCYIVTIGCSLHLNDANQQYTDFIEGERGIEDVSDESRIERRRVVGPIRDDEKRSCKCQCRDQYRQGQWKCCSCTWTETSCFPGNVKVTLQNGSHALMENVNIGDMVATVSDTGSVVYTEVRSFLHRETGPTTHAQYVTIQTEEGDTISLSKSHLIFAASVNTTGSMMSRFAEEVIVGDYIFHAGDGSGIVPKRVARIYQEVLPGVYVPLTAHGTLLVNDIYASCYAAATHGLSHVALAPMRWFPALLDADPQRQGIRPYVKIVKSLAMYVLPDAYKSARHRSNPDRRCDEHGSVSRAAHMVSTLVWDALSWN